MKKYILLVTVLFLSFNAFSVFTLFSSSDIYTTQNDVNLRLDKSYESKVLKVLQKDTKLALMTMHHSGWSKVFLDDVQGWILSIKLTREVPKSSSKVETIVDNNSIIKIQNLEKQLLDFELKNQQLSSLIVDIKALSDKKTQKNNSLSKENRLLSTKNKTLSEQNTILQDRPSTLLSGNNINLYFAAIFVLLFGFTINALFTRLRRRRRRFDTVIRRPY